MRFIEGGEFAQGLDHHRKRASITFAIGRFLADAFEAFFDIPNLAFGCAPEAANQLAACFGRVVAAAPRRSPARDRRQSSRRIFRAAVEPIVKCALIDLVLGENLRDWNAVDILLAHPRDFLG
jgi:hypothetical protein